MDILRDTRIKMEITSIGTYTTNGTHLGDLGPKGPPGPFNSIGPSESNDTMKMYKCVIIVPNDLYLKVYLKLHTFVQEDFIIDAKLPTIIYSIDETSVLVDPEKYDEVATVLNKNYDLNCRYYNVLKQVNELGLTLTDKPNYDKLPTNCLTYNHKQTITDGSFIINCKENHLFYKLYLESLIKV